MTAVLQSKDNLKEQVLYMVMELSDKKWKLCFSNGKKNRFVTVEAGQLWSMWEQIKLAKEKLGLAPNGEVISCYEAGRDGFWIHRTLEEGGVSNVVVDSASIEVNRRHRRAKTDKIDVKALLRQLQRLFAGEHKAMSVVRVPSVEAEDSRRLHRERDRLLKERGAHCNRIQSLLVVHGIRLKPGPKFIEQLAEVSSPAGYVLGADTQAELVREYERYQLVDSQVKELEAEQKRRAETAQDEVMKQIIMLMNLKGIGRQSSWKLVMEFFGWRQFRNRREVGACAGLTPTPYASGDSEREQGISKAGNKRIRTLMVELSWFWLRHQPNSALSKWFQQRFAQGGKRMRRIGIVAMARKLLIALWRFVEDGVIPEGAELKPGC